MSAMKPFASFVCKACRRSQYNSSATKPIFSRTFASSTRSRADGSVTSGLDSMLSSLAKTPTGHRSPSSGSRSAFGGGGGELTSFLSDQPPAPGSSPSAYQQKEQPHRLHVYATKHNTHMTLTEPASFRDENAARPTAPVSATDKVLLSFSSGNIRFKKAGRGSYDAGFQLAAFVLKQMQERNLMRKIKDMHVILRGFGSGREAVSKAIMGQEGRFVRNKIRAVTDATKLKFGGPRSPKPRRLG